MLVASFAAALFAAEVEELDVVGRRRRRRAVVAAAAATIATAAAVGRRGAAALQQRLRARAEGDGRVARTVVVLDAGEREQQACGGDGAFFFTGCCPLST